VFGTHTNRNKVGSPCQRRRGDFRVTKDPYGTAVHKDGPSRTTGIWRGIAAFRLWTAGLADSSRVLEMRF